VIGLGYRGSTGWDVEYELRDIRAFYRDARLYFGASATEETLEREHADLLHLALVFRYNPAAPGNTAAVFSDGRSADLTTRISLGRFSSLSGYRTVVVSDLWPGKEGASSVIAPSLLSGGATAVVVTAYTPSRKAKKVFSESFYTALLGGADVQTALRSVYNEMIGDPEFASPFVWGTYALWGD
jgi:CHAT domain-containing protein